MARGRPRAALDLTAVEREQLNDLARSRSDPFSIVQRARIVLACADGETGKAVAERFDVTGMTVGKWRRRFTEQGIGGLHDATRPGRPREIGDEQVMALINCTLQQAPDGATRWRTRRMADRTGG